MSHDLRYACRMLVNSPGFSLVAILTLALGIGANTAIFSVVHALLLRPLPYLQPDRLVMVWQDFTARGGPATEWASPGNYFDWRNSAELFAGVAAVQGWQPSLTGVGDPEPLVGEQVTPDYFGVIGVLPVLGRGLRADDGAPNAARVVVLSHELWQRRFAGDRDVVGQTVRLAGEPHEIVGVMPPGFRPVVVTAAELWRPLRLDAANPARGAIVLRIVARLRDGLSFEQARGIAAALARQLEQQHPEFNSRTGINLVSLHDQVVGDIRLGLLVLSGAVGFVLLIGCVNVANLLLARASTRSREIAVRVALGAARKRVLQQLLTESVVLASIGGALGLLVAVWGVSGLVATAPDGAPPLDDVGLNSGVLAFSVGLTLATGIAFGLVPALQASQADVAPALREGGRADSGPASRPLRRTLIVIEVAVALVLLVGGGLLMRTLLRLQAFDLGFDPAGVLVGFVAPPRAQYPTGDSRVAFYDRLLERVSALPGVEAAALSSIVPLGGDSDMTVWIEGRPLPRTDADATTTWYRLISADYLRAMGISLRSGRGFTPREPAPVVVVNETGARRFWPGGSALGKRVRFDDRDAAPWFTVIGVAEDVRIRGARGAPRTEMYLPYWQLPEPGINIVLKASGDPRLLAGPLRQAVREVDGDLPVASVAPMADLVSSSVAEPRFLALLVSVFAVLALLLAGVGIYGVMSYSVAQRRAEIGVRLALGAEPSDVFRLVVGDGVRMAGIGAAFGLLAASGLSRALGSLLFGVAPRDPLTFGAMTAVLMAVAVLANLIPAFRATRVDPMVALRTE